MNSTEVAQNPYGIAHMLQNGDYVTWLVAGVLLIMSMASWFILFIKLWDQRRLKQQYFQMQKTFWTAGNVRDGLAKLKGKDNAYRAIVESGLRAAEHHEGRMTDQIPLHEWITTSLQRSVDQINSRLRGGLSVLATTGSTAPFVGLLGTVWGILHALLSIGLSGNPSIDRVAGPVGEALQMTAFGLFVAIPAVMSYNWLLGRTKGIQEQLRYFVTDLHAYLVSGARVDTGAGGSSTPRPAVATGGARK